MLARPIAIQVRRDKIKISATIAKLNTDAILICRQALKSIGRIIKKERIVQLRPSCYFKCIKGYALPHKYI